MSYSDYYEKPPRVPYLQTLVLVSQSAARRAAQQCSACGSALNGFLSPTDRPLCAACDDSISVSEWDMGSLKLYQAAKAAPSGE